jgi:hypothetical protein
LIEQVIKFIDGLVLESQAKKLFAIYRTIDFNCVFSRWTAWYLWLEWVQPFRSMLFSFGKISSEFKRGKSCSKAMIIQSKLKKSSSCKRNWFGSSWGSRKAISTFRFTRYELVLFAVQYSGTLTRNYNGSISSGSFVTREIGSGTRSHSICLKKVSINLSNQHAERQYRESIKSYLNSNSTLFFITTLLKELKKNWQL